MCTVSWIHEDGGYQLFCNRDENRLRKPALDPQVHTRDGVHFLAPIDGEFGGTWIATNEFRVSVCLLNGTVEGRSRRQDCHRSRGLIVFDLASADSLQEVNRRVWRSDLAPYAPFKLLVIEPGQYATVIEWDGAEKRILPYAEAYMPLVSSSFEPLAVREQRRRHLSRIADRSGELGPAALLIFHLSHAPECGPYSPCMHRADAETVSFSWVTVTDSEASFYYAAGAPCRSLTGESYTLALRQEENVECLAYC